MMDDLQQLIVVEDFDQEEVGEALAEYMGLGDDESPAESTVLELFDKCMDTPVLDFIEMQGVQDIQISAEDWILFCIEH